MTSSTIFQPTLLQRILGKNYKWWYIFLYYSRLESAYFVTNLFHFFGQSISIYTALLIWNVSNPTSELFTELLVGLIFLTFTSSTVYWHLGEVIERGGLSKLLITPTSLMKYYLFFSLSGVFRFVVYYSIILSPLFVLFGNKIIIGSFSVFLLTLPLFLSIGFLLRFLLAFMVGLSAFWTTMIYGQANLYENAIPLLIGVLFPYNLVTVMWLKQLLLLSPWSFVVYHPMQIYLGKYDTTQTLMVFAGGIGWCIVLYLLAKFIFKLGLKRNEAVGL
jgi:ABC-2 type transport system permease protein